MRKLWALADLHLSLDGEKPMHVFGEQWRDHPRKMAEAWDTSVGQEDLVLLPGDLSWARTLEQAAPDLAWIGERPGEKLLLKGNHDSWWRSQAKVRAALPDRCELLHQQAYDVGPCVVLGARGWTAPDDPIAIPEDAPLFRRELERLRLSMVDADRRFGREKPRLAMTHYPPWIEGRAPTDVVPLLQKAGVTTCVYGHLHGKDHRLGLRGLHGGIRFILAASDYIDFSPIEIPVPE
jgi:predicted phosphohydrolase